MNDNLEISKYFFFGFYGKELIMNYNNVDNEFYDWDIITKEKAKEIIDFLTKFVEEK